MIPQTPTNRNVRKKENDVLGLCLRKRIRHSIFLCLALVMVFAVFLLTTVNVHANPVTLDDQAGVLHVESCSDTIDDEAGVLNEERVLAETAKLKYCMFIYTTDRFTGDQDALNKYTRERLPADQHSIAIGIDTIHRNLSIEFGTDVTLANSNASDAVSAFQSNYNGGNYTGATIAAIDSLQNAFGANETLGVIIFIIGIVVVVLAVFFIIRYIVSIRRGGGSDGRPRSGFWGGSYDSGSSSGSYDSGSSGGGAGGHF